jgi:hypothetical protein
MRTPPCPTQAARCALSERSLHVSVLTWSFAFFNSVRVLAYLPTICPAPIEMRPVSVKLGMST